MINRNFLRRFSIHNLTYFQLFMAFEIGLFIVFNIVNLIHHGYYVSKLFLNLFNRYDDYFMHLGYAAVPYGTNIYEFDTTACFPPLAYLLYGFLARVVGYYTTDPTNEKLHQLAGHNMTIYILYTVVCTILIVYATSQVLKKRGIIYQLVLPCVLILTYPISFAAIQRGNSVLLVVSLVCLALAWRNDESKVKRELAMLIIAIAAGLKIYPAVLGLLYIKERRYKEMLRLIIYGVVLFFGPFVFFGGLAAMRTFFSTLYYLNGEVHRCSVSGLIEAITTGLFNRNIHTFTIIMQNLFLVLSLLAFFLTKDKWGETLILCSLMAVYISSSWMYTCVYMIPVLLVFFAEKDSKPICINKNNWQDIIAMLLFACVFSFSYDQGFPFLYDSITILTTVYSLVIIFRAAYRKFWLLSVPVGEQKAE